MDVVRRPDDRFARAARVRPLILDEFGLEDVTVVGPDWGGLIGLRFVAGRALGEIVAGFVTTLDDRPGRLD